MGHGWPKLDFIKAPNESLSLPHPTSKYKLTHMLVAAPKEHVEVWEVATCLLNLSWGEGGRPIAALHWWGFPFGEGIGRVIGIPRSVDGYRRSQLPRAAAAAAAAAAATHFPTIKSLNGNNQWCTRE
jgi:hypothetical protein